MKRLTWNVLIAALLLVFLIPFVGEPVSAKGKEMAVQIAGSNAQITLLNGSAWLLKRAMKKEQSLTRGAILFSGDRIRTGKQSRIEVRLPDDSYLRFDEETTFRLISAEVDPKTTSRNVRVSMILGKTWARVSKLFRGRGRFAIQTPTAVAGVRGTVYRMNLNADHSAVVKVYSGEIDVSSLQKDAAAGPPGPLIKPHPVPGPHPVTMEQWTYIVRALQQINIRPDGKATKPFRFDIAADLNDWVRWNQMRDQVLEAEE